MMNQKGDKMFKIEDVDFAVFARNGSGRVTCRVDGYWSSDVITIYVDRGYSFRDDGTWNVKLSHSSGGRDTDVIACDLEAEANFGHALIAMSDFAKQIKANIDVLEQSYAEYSAEVKEAQRIAEAKRQAELAADPSIGTEKAKNIVDMMIAEARLSDFRCDKTFKKRVSDDTITIRAEKHFKKTMFYIVAGRYGQNRISKQDAVEYIASYSRTPAPVAA